MGCAAIVQANRVARHPKNYGSDLPNPGAAVAALQNLVLASAAVLGQDVDGGVHSTAPEGSSLPVPRTTFVGRVRAMQVVQELLDARRVVTITGPGGAGKTRLAVEVARRRQKRLEDPIWFVELAPVAHGALVGGAVAAAVGAAQPPGRPAVAAVRDAIGDRPGVLLLDSCERVLEAAAEVANALAVGCPRLTVLATSREPLRISGEAVVTLPPLEVGSEAVYLFADRAAAALPGFAITDRNRSAVTDICRRLDGLPLAIELAAPLVAVMPPAQLAEELDHRFDILADGPRDAPAQQRSLRASVEWSHELLAEDERRLFGRLAVFEHSFSLEAVRAIAAAAAPSAPLRLLTRLVEKSVVLFSPDSEDGRPYRLLETVREFAREQLRASGDEEDVRRLHFDHFLHLAEHASSQHLETGSTEPVKMLAGAAGDLRAALSWSATASPESHLRLATAMYPYWRAFALQEGAASLIAALESAPGATRDRARALVWAGTLAGYSYEVELAGRLLEEGLALSTELGDRTTAAWARLELGTAAWLRLEFDESRALLKSSLAAMNELGSAFGRERAALHLGTTMVWLDRAEEGATLLEEALSLAGALGDAWGAAFAAEMLGWAEISAGRPARADPHLRSAARAAILGPVGAGAVEGLAQVAAASGDRTRALRLLGFSEQLLACFNGQCARPIAIRSEALQQKLSSAVGPATVAALLAEGRALDLREGVAYACDGKLPKRQPRGPLTEREIQIARLVAEGLTSREIAARLHLSVRTVESHVDHALNKLDFNSRTQLALWIRDSGIGS